MSDSYRHFDYDVTAVNATFIWRGYDGRRLPRLIYDALARSEKVTRGIVSSVWWHLLSSRYRAIVNIRTHQGSAIFKIYNRT